MAAYGSPNVFHQFMPHVTLATGHDAASVAAAVVALEANGTLSPTRYTGDLLAMGQVGPFGTVLKGKDVAKFNVSVRGDEACSKVYADEASCTADQVTEGGCIWCDIVDRPAFCTTDRNARSLQPPPQGPPFQCNWKTTGMADLLIHQGVILDWEDQ